MTEEEERETRSDILKERIDGLEWLVAVLIGTLSDDQKGYIKDRLATRARYSEEDARRRDTDPAREKAAIAYELSTDASYMAEDSAGGYEIYLEEKITQL